MFQYVLDRAKADHNIRQHLGFGPLTVRLEAGETATLLTLSANDVSLQEAVVAPTADITLSATNEAWAELARAEPAPGFQTLSTMRRTRHLDVTGDMLKFQHHMYLLERLFSNLSDELPTSRDADTAEPSLEPVTGRYLRLSIEGRAHRVYFEEAGPDDGIPLLCLHTAGSDGRQWRHILNDTEITKRYRVIAFDLPWHGKSSPPAGFEHDVYTLTTDGYVAIIMAIVDALALQRPVVMGCSIGGRVVLHLGLRHSDRFRALIGLQSALYANDESSGDPSPESALHRPDIHGGKLAGTLMAGMTAPQSPSSERWETMWHYMQGGPGIFAGDLDYYFEEGDLSSADLEPLKQSTTPVYLLSGNYDVSATPEMGRDVAKLIDAQHFEEMHGVGHFPMSENPVVFANYIRPVLDEIATAN